MLALFRFTGVILGIVLCASLTAPAAIEPSFDTDECIEAATDIVVASQASSGELSILEVWKGDLKKGDKLTLSHLPAAPLPALSHFPAVAFDKSLDGKRIVMFLKPSSDAALHDKYTGATMLVWEGKIGDETPTSAVWIDGSCAYAFIQVMNPGDSLPIAIPMTERQLKGRTLTILNSDENDIRAALRITDLNRRIQALELPASSGSVSVRRDAFAAIGDCGRNAVGYLVRMFSERATDLDLVVDAIARAAGSQSDYEMNRLLLDEITYWRTTAPLLKIGWQSEKAADGSARYAGLLVQYQLLKHTLDKITVGKRDDQYSIVPEVHDFWLATPQLNDESDPDGVISRCNTRLESRSNGEPSTAP